MFITQKIILDAKDLYIAKLESEKAKLKERISSLERLENAIDSIPEGWGWFKHDSEKVTSSNDSLIKMFGYSSKDDIKDTPLLNFVEKSKENLEKVFAALTDEQSNPREILLLRKDGSVFPGIVQGTPIVKSKDLDGNIEKHDSASVLIKDISEIVQYQEALIKKTEEAELAREEMAAINEELSRSQQALEQANNELLRKDADNVRDRAMAAAIQRSFFISVPPENEYWDIDIYSRPLTQVSGDFWDFYTISDRLFASGIFDVSGHGIASGLIAVVARRIFFDAFKENYQNAEKTFSDIVEIANERIISETGKVDNYLTGLILFFKNQKEVALVCAGHSALLHKRAFDGDIVRRSDGGFFLGSKVLACKYDTAVFNVEKGDFLIAYTDGLTEARNKQGEVYGLDRLEKIIKFASVDISSRALKKIILEDLYSFIEDKSLIDDDITLIIHRRK